MVGSATREKRSGSLSLHLRLVIYQIQNLLPRPVLLTGTLAQCPVRDNPFRFMGSEFVGTADYRCTCDVNHKLAPLPVNFEQRVDTGLYAPQRRTPVAAIAIINIQQKYVSFLADNASAGSCVAGMPDQFCPSRSDTRRVIATTPDPGWVRNTG